MYVFQPYSKTLFHRNNLITLSYKRDEMQVIFSRVISHNLDLDFCSSLHAFRTGKDSSGSSIDSSFMDKSSTIIKPKGLNLFIIELIGHKK